jgi:methyl halide transferase
LPKYGLTEVIFSICNSIVLHMGLDIIYLAFCCYLQLQFFNHHRYRTAGILIPVLRQALTKDEIKNMNEEYERKSSLPGNELNDAYWNARWQNGETGWDIGYAAPAITEYMNQQTNKRLSILIPGCGNAYEAGWLAGNGFANITLIDIAPEAVTNLKKKFAGETKIKIICGDFFEHTGNYDLVIEQTFFCALQPEQRNAYVQKTASLLNGNGKIAGLLFNRAFEKEGPPFGGTVEEYRLVFEPYFNIQALETCYNSIPSRKGNELFILFEKREAISSLK